MKREILNLPNADIILFPAFFPPQDADRLFTAIRDTTPWRQDTITLFGAPKPLPRLTAWHGDPGINYTYSGIKNTPAPWTQVLLGIKTAIEPPAMTSFNGVLLNRYRTGRDSMGWHADDEPEFGACPIIASVSLGSTRRFQLRHNQRRVPTVTIDLTHGSLLIMRGETQHHWQHQVPKTAKPVGERLNLTFRNIIHAPTNP